MNSKFYTTFEAAEMCHVNPASVSRWIHEGKLAASSTAGGHFRIQPEELVRLLQSLRMPVPKELQNHSSPKKLLIVDDEPGVRKFLKAFLSRSFPDLILLEAEDGFSAGAQLTSSLPDLVLLDLRIPSLNGFRVCEFIRQAPELKHTRIIVITGMEDKNVGEMVTKLGVDDLFQKPLDSARLKQRIAVYLGLTEVNGARSE